MNDLKFAFRQLRQHPLTNGVIILTIALLIGAVSVIYASLRNEQARFVPFPEPDQMMKLWRLGDKRIEELFPADLFHEYADRLKSFEGLGALGWRQQMTLTDVGEPVSYHVMGASVSLLPLTKVAPLRGRLFDESDAESGTDQVVIISEQMWRDKLGGDNNIIGRQLRLNDRLRTVIGVLPESMRNTWLAFQTDIWMLSRLPRDRQGVDLWLMGRLKPGVTQAQAQAEIDTMAPHLEKSHVPDKFERQVYPGGFQGARVQALSKPITNRGGGTPSQMIFAWIFGGTIIASVVGIACFNVTNLLLARVNARSRELAIRLALGARRWRIMRQLLTETVLLALLGGLVGLIVSFWLFDLFRLRDIDVRLDWRLYLLTCSGTLALGVLVGLLPAFRSAATDLNESLKDGGQTTVGKRRHRWRDFLVSSEVAMALILCVVAGLMTRAFLRFYTTDLGFDAARLVTVRVDLRGDRYGAMEDRRAYGERALQSLREMPGVDAAAISMSFDLLGWAFRDRVTIAAAAGAEEKTTEAVLTYGSDELASLTGMPLLRGRGLSTDAALASGEALVNEQFVRQNLGSDDPLGRQIAVAQGSSSGKRSYTIVGVVRNRHPLTSFQETRSEVVLGFREAQMHSGLILLARTKASAKAMAPTLREVIQRLDASQPVNQPIFVSDLVEQRAAGVRSGMIFLGSLAGVGLFIALMGVYGVVAFSVVERTHEVGIRLALGAGRRDILRLMSWQGARLLLFGALPGMLIGSLIITGLPGQSLIAGLSAFDLPTYVAVLIVVGAAGFLASFLPAKKAAELSPMQALRRE
jgi:predicted permease